ncbi:alanine--tRNA ligase-related protein [Methanothrix sp.]|jgi:misacylated tRNA(Ala) deacylase|uniref:alanine--tRNA ligase-related protein n=1 Tax=Methanothrix sp. TaxID=90426 RepID=UPI001BD2DDE6
MRQIYIQDSYIRSFETRVVDTKALDAEGEGVILQETAFYPQSGGQPSDAGSLFRSGDEFRVLRVEPSGSLHILDRRGLEPGDSISGIIDWDRRYRFMRSHTACHILSAVIFKETGARITGNQIDLARSRVDFSLEAFDKSKIAEYVEQANSIISEDRAVRISLLPRSEAMEIPDLVRLAMDVPDREVIRVIDIEGVDQQACGGTHIRRTGEIGGIKLLKAENKGKSNRRIYFELVDRP